VKRIEEVPGSVSSLPDMPSNYTPPVDPGNRSNAAPVISIILGLGAFVVGFLLAVALFNTNPSPFIFWIPLALALGGFVMGIRGFYIAYKYKTDGMITAALGFITSLIGVLLGALLEFFAILLYYVV